MGWAITWDAFVVDVVLSRNPLFKPLLTERKDNTDIKLNLKKPLGVIAIAALSVNMQMVG